MIVFPEALCTDSSDNDERRAPYPMTPCPTFALSWAPLYRDSNIPSASQARREGAMNVRPLAPLPRPWDAGCGWCRRGVLPPSLRVVRSGGDAQCWFSALLQLLQCAIFRRAQSGRGGASWQGMSSPPQESQLTFL